MMRYVPLLFSALLLSAAPAALAQTLAPGTAIVDPQGQPVGTVTAVRGDAVTVRTDRHEVRLPLASIRVDKTNGVVGMTQAELNADVDRAMAQLSTALTAGATVYDPAGQIVGTIGESAENLITLRLASTREVRLPREAFSLGRRGVVVGLTAAQIEAQLPPAS